MGPPSLKGRSANPTAPAAVSQLSLTHKQPFFHSCWRIGYISKCIINCFKYYVVLLILVEMHHACVVGFSYDLFLFGGSLSSGQGSVSNCPLGGGL